MRRQPHVFEIDTAHQDDAYIVQIRGELDLAGCPALELALEEAERSKATRVVLDLEDLTFTDARGLGTMLEASRRSARNGNRLQITRGKGQVAHIFRLTELDTGLPLADAALCPAIRSSPDGQDSSPAPLQPATRTEGAGADFVVHA
jgi:anti-anti-sigma factor